MSVKQSNERADEWGADQNMALNRTNMAPFATVLEPFGSWRRQLFIDVKISDNGGTLGRIVAMFWSSLHPSARVIIAACGVLIPGSPLRTWGTWRPLESCRRWRRGFAPSRTASSGSRPRSWRRRSRNLGAGNVRCGEIFWDYYRKNVKKNFKTIKKYIHWKLNFR